MLIYFVMYCTVIINYFKNFLSQCCLCALFKLTYLNVLSAIKLWASFNSESMFDLEIHYEVKCSQKRCRTWLVLSSCAFFLLTAASWHQRCCFSHQTCQLIKTGRVQVLLISLTSNTRTPGLKGSWMEFSLIILMCLHLMSTCYLWHIL